MTRKTIAILRKLVCAELKEYRADLRGEHGDVFPDEKKWYEARIKEFEACLEEIKEVADEAGH